MIGGLSFLLNGKMCFGDTSTGIMVRVGPEAPEWTLAETQVRPMVLADRPLAGFVCVDPVGYQTDTALATWIQRGLDVAATLPMKKPVWSRRTDLAQCHRGW